jgi:hypothetical protein
VEYAKASGVISFIVVPSMVCKYSVVSVLLLVVLVNSYIDGKGTGAWNQLSVLLPIFINSAIYKRGVYHFAENTVSFLYLAYDVSSC